MVRPDKAALALFAGAALALSGCNIKAHGDNGEDASITIGGGNATDDGKTANGQQSVAIDVPGFSAKVNVPDLDIGDDTKIEDMPLFPGTKVNGVNISAHDGDGDGDSRGDVTMAFTAPADTGKVIAWYKDQAGKHGWDVVPATGENQFEATKQEDGKGPTHFALQVASATGGSSGRFIVTGR
ncbi:hypothetical protein HZF05_03235 [Sphingomonas sp. CGMCC 1.13654]|uniref:Uncharacterized protein n=1 Tax=Sphingomonas chungangi TaxID=2683589 RepID=A0A838L1N7_9SPHN|nr:hypothetical protein [Sphingomonas chungangi]MBA2933104.1 hypothetical protein [Sphingomonas chungangi]MVW56724.1 hypothetical protein [Sphingomonas chungangi]